MAARDRVIVAVTGASAPQYAVRMLEVLRDNPDVETHVVVSRGAARTIGVELDMTVAQVTALADVAHRPDDLGASISSGSFPVKGMIVVPCSMKTLGLIASGIGGDLISRAADVTLKERRRLVLVTRETPLSYIHLRNMVEVTQAGAIVMPPVPAFYHRPQTLQDVIDQSVGRILDQLDIPHDLAPRWGQTAPDPEDGRR